MLVTFGVMQDFIPCPILFNSLDAGLKGILNKLGNDTKLGGAVDSFGGREALQRDRNKLEMSDHQPNEA